MSSPTNPALQQAFPANAESHLTHHQAGGACKPQQHNTHLIVVPHGRHAPACSRNEQHQVHLQQVAVLQHAAQGAGRGAASHGAAAAACLVLLPIVARGGVARPPAAAAQRRICGPQFLAQIATNRRNTAQNNTHLELVHQHVGVAPPHRRQHLRMAAQQLHGARQHVAAVVQRVVGETGGGELGHQLPMLLCVCHCATPMCQASQPARKAHPWLAPSKQHRRQPSTPHPPEIDFAAAAELLLVGRPHRHIRVLPSKVGGHRAVPLLRLDPPL